MKRERENKRAGKLAARLAQFLCSAKLVKLFDTTILLLPLLRKTGPLAKTHFRSIIFLIISAGDSAKKVPWIDLCPFILGLFSKVIKKDHVRGKFMWGGAWVEYRSTLPTLLPAPK